MSIPKLTAKEIEQKIEEFRKRIITLSEIIKDVSDKKAKSSLEVHWHSYQESLDLLREELEKRNEQAILIKY